MDWRLQKIIDFCDANKVGVYCDDLWKEHQKCLIMRKGRYTVERLIDYDVIPTLLITPILNEMYRELEGKSPVEVDE